MVVTVNGEERDLAPGSTLSDLLQQLGLNPKVVVAQRNGDIVPREDFPATMLADADIIDLIRFVGGG
ncbi:MAG TPA: sulfur carrier protein ThiS [Candidatus Hydrogenedentes bacterium]|nr:sulfur carrier protein ThiS [Candidatus Hydrogenedentota bacterium]